MLEAYQDRSDQYGLGVCDMRRENIREGGMVKRFLVWWAEMKNYLGYAMHYLGIINFTLLLATFKKTYGIQVSAYVIVPIGIIMMLLVGWLDYKYIAGHQIAHSNAINDLKHQLDRIERRIS